MNHINNLQSKQSYLSINDFELGYSEIEEIFSHYGQLYLLTGTILRSEYLQGESDGEQCYDYSESFHDLQLFWLDENDDQHEIELTEEEIIELIF